MCGSGSAVYQHHKAITLSKKQPMVLFLWGAHNQYCQHFSFVNYLSPQGSGLKRNPTKREKKRAKYAKKQVSSIPPLLRETPAVVCNVHQRKAWVENCHCWRQLWLDPAWCMAWVPLKLWYFTCNFYAVLFDADCKLLWELNWETFSIFW